MISKFILTLISLTWLAQLSFAQEAYLVAEASSEEKNWKATVTLNGFTMVVLSKNMPQSMGTPVDLLLKKNGNILKVENSEKVKVLVQIAKFKKGEFPSFNAPLNDVFAELKSAGAKEFIFPKSKGPWAWESLPKLVVRKSTKKEILVFLNRVKNDLAKGETILWDRATLVNSNEVMRAFSFDAATMDQRKSSSKSRLKELLAKGAKVTLESNINLVLTAGGRLIEPRGADNEPVLKVTLLSEGGVMLSQMKYSMKMAKHKGKWAIYRL